MSVARFIADQRTMHGVPHTFTCAILAVSVSWFYKSLHREPTPTEIRRRELDAAVKAFFEASKRTYGSPADPSRSRRGRLDGEREHRRGLDATTRIARSETEATQGIDPSGQVGAEVPGSAEAGLRRRGAEREMVRRHDRDPHRRGQALHGHRLGPVLSQVAGQPDLGAPGCRAGL